MNLNEPDRLKHGDKSREESCLHQRVDDELSLDGQKTGQLICQECGITLPAEEEEKKGTNETEMSTPFCLSPIVGVVEPRLKRRSHVSIRSKNRGHDKMARHRPLMQFFLFLLLGIVSAQLALAASGDPVKGKIIYERDCVTCHGERGKGDGPAGAALRPPASDLKSAATKAKADHDLLKVIQDGRNVMPRWKNRLSEQEIQNVLAYIRSLGE